LRIRQLHYFYALGRYLNYKQATDALCVTQSVLSQQIADLEHELGVPLFRRDKKSLALTPAGEELMGRLPDLFKLMSQAVNLVRDKSDEVSEGVLRIGFEKPVPDREVSRLVRSFRAVEPGVRCMVSQYGFQHLASSLEDGEVDVGFFMLPCSGLPRDLSFHVVSRDSLVLAFRRQLLAASPSGSVREAISGRRVFCFEKNAGGTPQVFRACHALDIVPELTFCDEVDEIMCNVASGLGVSILPRNYVDRSGFGGEMILADLAGFDVGGLCVAAAFHPERCTPAALRFLSQLPACITDCAACANTSCHLHRENVAPQNHRTT
jgi:DNA-binding transcriptional LysR family regulator